MFWFGISLEYPKLETVEMGYTMIIFFYSKSNNLGLGIEVGISRDISR